MKRILQDTPKTKKFLDSLPTLYFIGVWIGCGVREIKFSGKCDTDGMPLVYDYYDGNGTCSEWLLIRLENVTTGSILAWGLSKQACRALAEAYDKTLRP